MEDYFTATPGASGGCSAVSESGTMVQTCTLSVSGSTASAGLTYDVDITLFGSESLVLNSQFSLATGGTTVSMSPLFSATNLGIAPAGKIIFVTANAYSGNLESGGGVAFAGSIPGIPAASGVQGGDAICQYEASQAGLPGTYTALLVSSTRYPCNGSGVCGESGASDWHVRSSQTYVTTDDLQTVILTSDPNGIFENNYAQNQIKTPSGSSLATNVWSGINGILTGSTVDSASSITGWSYANNSATWTGGAWDQYADDTCSDWTSSSGNVVIGDTGNDPDSNFSTAGLNIYAGYSSPNANDLVANHPSRWVTNISSCNNASGLICIQQ